MQPRIPRGLRDILPIEAAERRTLATRCRNVFESWGYGEISTPAFEYFDVLTTETGEEISREMFRFVDSDGRLVSLRPEMTTPIARAVAQRMSAEPAPHRLYYVQNVFRDEPAQRGQQREFWQAGVELVGARGAAADMEIIALTAEALLATGLTDFKLGIGHVGLFRDVLEASGMDAEAKETAQQLATARNLVALRELVAAVSADARERVMALVDTRGGSEAIDAAREIVGSGPGGDSLDELAETYRLLDAYGLGGLVMLDFGLIRSFDYYTGFVLEVYAPGMSFPLGAGGRYDTLLAEFGRPMPAAGCALGLERLHIAVAEQIEVIVAGEAGLRVAWESDAAAALLVAKDLRGMGIAVTLSLEAVSAEELAAQVHERQERAVLVASDTGELVLMDPLAETTRFTTAEGLIEELSQ